MMFSLCSCSRVQITYNKYLSLLHSQKYELDLSSSFTAMESVSKMSRP